MAKVILRRVVRVRINKVVFNKKRACSLGQKGETPDCTNQSSNIKIYKSSILQKKVGRCSLLILDRQNIFFKPNLWSSTFFKTHFI